MAWGESPHAAEWQRDFGARLRALRKDRGLTQRQVADAADLDKTYLSSIEQGRRNVSLVNIHKLAEALGVGAADFFVGTG